MNRASHLRAVFCGLLGFPPLSTSALDSNANGVSDVWEALHPAAASAPAGDNDGDGVTNQREGACWTDPEDAGSALRAEGFQRSGNLSGFTFQERDWMRDAVLTSADLVEWTVLDPPRQGVTGDREVAVEDAASSGFYQIARHDALNSDTDALTNLEEQKLGTDPLLWDSDGDKVADDVEFLIGTNPLLAGDGDGDNLPDDWEEWIIRSDSGDDVTDKSDVTAATDFDDDGVTDGDEFALGTSPVRALRNVLLFLTEDQGADLGCMGTVGLETPSVDSLAQSGVMFERAFCLSPVCSPSKMAMFTGTYPHTTSAHRNVPNYGTSFPLAGDPSNVSLGAVHEDMPTLIEILRDRGFFTAVSHKTHVQPVRKWPYHKGYGQPTTASVATSYVNDLVASAGDRPFYMTFGIGAPHLPFRGILQNQGKWSATGGLTGDGHATNVDANAIVVPNCYPDEPGVRQDIADYYGAIECVDEVFGAVMSALQANGVLDETLVIYTSDHGIGLHRSKQSVYATGTRVPFIVAGAGISGNVTIDAPVSHLDVVPTLLDYLGIPLFPNMPGKSLAPVLSGSSEVVSGRKTVMAAAHEKYDGRAVCDGRYYYIRNVRKIAGASLANPDTGLNADQFGELPPTSPWFNRTYAATLAASGSPQLQLLSDLLTGNVPDEELYDLDADPWCINNLAEDPALASVKADLRAELAAWRKRTEDYNESPVEMTRRTERYTDPTGGGTGSGVPVVDDFNGRTGALDADPAWTTLVPGNSGSDYQLGSDIADAPAGPLTLGVWNDGTLASGGEFSVSVKTGFDGTGVAGGIAFGITDNTGTASWWQFLLADGRSSIGGVDKDVRLFRVIDNIQQLPALLMENGLPNYATNGDFFTLEISGTEGSSLVSLRILDPNGAVYFNNPSFDLGEAVPAGSAFGITSWSSGASIFDDFGLALANGPRSVMLSFDSGSGDLSADADWSLAIAGNSGADFVFEANPFAGGTGMVIDAPPGSQPPLAVYNPIALGAGEAFHVSLETGFVGAGVYGGLVFGYQDNDNFLSFELADGATAATQDRLFRIRRRNSGTDADVLFPDAGALPTAGRNKLYRLTLEGNTGDTEISYAIRDVATDSLLTSGTIDLPAAVAAGSKFGIITQSSGASKYDNLSIETTP